MSWMTKEELQDRLKTATEESPLAVFTIDSKGHAKPGLVDVVFANTVSGQQRINAREGLVGVFHERSQEWNNQLEEVAA